MTAPAGQTAADIRVDPWPDAGSLRALMRAGWGGDGGNHADILDRSLCHVCAYDSDRLVGFVHVAWDGAGHGFLLDPTVHPDRRHRGIGTALVRAAVQASRERGAAVIHVDYEPHLEGFYAACGFVPSKAGIIRLR